MKSNLTKKKLPFVLIVIGLLFYCVSIDRANGATVTASPPKGNQYLVEFKSAHLPTDLQNRIAALGGRIIDTFPELKVALVANLTDASAAALRAQSDVSDVTEDELSPMPQMQALRRVESLVKPVPETIAHPENAKFYALQWDKRVIQADRTWAAGYLGDPNVRIAIIDSGIDPTHRDLVGLIDWTRSTSYCPFDTALVGQLFPGYPAW